MNPKRIIIDVREPVEFAMGHVEGSINISLDALISGNSILEQIEKDTEIIAYCRTGNRSMAFIIELKKKDFNDVVNGIDMTNVNKLIGNSR